MFSARAVYRTNDGKGIHAQVVAWQERRIRRESRLDALVAEIDGAGGPAAWAKAFKNSQTSPGRPSSEPGGSSKAATVKEAAERLHDRLTVKEASDITVENAHDVKAALLGVKGIGPATSNYFLMLLGKPGVKPDRMIHRFLDGNFTNAQAVEIISRVATELGVAEHELDHAIWFWESHRAARR